ncbi:ATP-binding protein OS=Streptomyces alboniger OX=132473 GN=CP975_18845 PE=4 SV=1 [Streptomyces alboniger]
MKAMKAAAVLAGSIAIAGSAAPAFAGDLTPSSLNGGLDAIASQGLDHALPVSTNMLDPENRDSVINTVKDTAEGLNSGGGPGTLLGGLPLAQ